MCPFLAIIPENTLPYRQNRTHKRPGLRCWNAGIPGDDYLMVAYPATIPQYTRGYGPRSHTRLSVTSISRPVSSPIPAQTQSLSNSTSDFPPRSQLVARPHHQIFTGQITGTCSATKKQCYGRMAKTLAGAPVPPLISMGIP